MDASFLTAEAKEQNFCQAEFPLAIQPLRSHFRTYLSWKLIKHSYPYLSICEGNVIFSSDLPECSSLIRLQDSVFQQKTDYSFWFFTCLFALYWRKKLKPPFFRKFAIVFDVMTMTSIGLCMRLFSQNYFGSYAIN